MSSLVIGIDYLTCFSHAVGPKRLSDNERTLWTLEIWKFREYFYRIPKSHV